MFLCSVKRVVVCRARQRSPRFVGEQISREKPAKERKTYHRKFSLREQRRANTKFNKSAGR